MLTKFFVSPWVDPSILFKYHFSIKLYIFYFDSWYILSHSISLEYFPFIFTVCSTDKIKFTLAKGKKKYIYIYFIYFLAFITFTISFWHSKKVEYKTNLMKMWWKLLKQWVSCNFLSFSFHFLFFFCLSFKKKRISFTFQFNFN